jgi:hypothetical protein
MAVSSIGLSGCFTTAADFRADAEAFIVEDVGLRDATFPDAETTFTSATCTEPANQEAGTRFPCTAVDSDGDTWEFEIVITSSSGYDVNITRRPLGS